MSLDESALALALLALVMVFVVAGVAFQHARLYRVAGLLPDDRIAPFRHHLVASAAAVTLVVVFWVALGALSWRQGFELPPDAIDGVSVTETSPLVVVDGLEQSPAAPSAE